MSEAQSDPHEMETPGKHEFLLTRKEKSYEPNQLISQDVKKIHQKEYLFLKIRKEYNE